MGLKHQAFHAMLANPHLAPFEIIDRPCQRQDWTLLDHLMVIHKVKESDYIEGDSHGSILNMARTLACCYVTENAGSRCVVLVKDGAGAPKPAVRETRSKRPPVPHIDFCRRNLPAIEYTMMKLLADMGMANTLFLVTGAKGCSTEDTEALLEGSSVDNVVSFHEKYREYRDGQDDGVFVNTVEDLMPLECELSDVDPSYVEVDGSIDRPAGLDGVFVATFAHPETSQVSVLRDACLQCASTEADTLLVELANILVGSVVVCTGDSDLVAVLTACGREGITLRMDNRSYREGRDMHTSTFGELLFAAPEKLPPKLLDGALSSSGDRFRALCDVAAEDEHLLRATRDHHAAFEATLDDEEQVVAVARYLYLGGIRGSLYSVFLSRVFNAGARTHGLDALKRSVGFPSANTVRFIFETVYPASESSLSEPDDKKPPSAGEKRKASCLDREPELGLEDGVCNVVPSKEEGKFLLGTRRLSKAYMNGLVPKGSHGRFLRLNGAGPHFFVRVKRVQDPSVRMERLVFMALCGTDYNIVPRGLGIKRLMTGVVTNHKAFSKWCQELKSLLWGSDSGDCGYHSMGMRLACLTKVPPKIRSDHWTGANCGLMFKTMKYVCELWNMKRPRPGPEYGFSARDGTVGFDREDSLLVDADD